MLVLVVVRNLVSVQVLMLILVFVLVLMMPLPLLFGMAQALRVGGQDLARIEGGKLRSARKAVEVPQFP